MAGNGGRAELRGDESCAMRLLRALLRSASPGSIPQQVDFYSRFSPSPLSMKQFLDFGKYPHPPPSHHHHHPSTHRSPTLGGYPRYGVVGAVPGRRTLPPFLLDYSRSG